MGTVADGGRERVVVGVNESRAARNAVLWGAAAARLHHRNLIIAHVAPPDGPARSIEVAAAQEHLLNASAAAASRREPTVAVGTLLLHGVVGDELVKLTNAAMFLVLGVDAARRRSDYGVLGSVEDRVVVHARCPVVTVPHALPTSDADRTKVVAVWTPGKTSHQVLEVAALEATLSSGTVSVVAGFLPDVDGQRLAVSSFEGSLAGELGEVAARYPQLSVRVAQVTGNLAEEVSRASLDADLVVMASERSDDRWSIRTGLLAATSMRQSACPILFVNASSPRREAGHIMSQT